MWHLVLLYSMTPIPVDLPSGRHACPSAVVKPAEFLGIASRDPRTSVRLLLLRVANPRLLPGRRRMLAGQSRSVVSHPTSLMLVPPPCLQRTSLGKASLAVAPGLLNWRVWQSR